jgi:hypothetical protein
MMFLFRFTIYYLGIHFNRRDIEKRLISEIKGQIQRASKINGHDIAFSLPKRNIVKRRNFRAKPWWISFTAIFPLALSMETASRINGQQQETVKKSGKFAAKARKCVALQAKETGSPRSHRVLGLREQRELGQGSAHLVGSSASAEPLHMRRPTMRLIVDSTKPVEILRPARCQLR